MTNNNYVCADCGCDLTQDGFIASVCPACGGTDALPHQLYDDNDGRQPAPSEHAPVKHAAFSGDGEFVVAEESNPEAWVCVDVEASGSGAIVEVRE